MLFLPVHTLSRASELLFILFRKQEFFGICLEEGAELFVRNTALFEFRQCLRKNLGPGTAGSLVAGRIAPETTSIDVQIMGEENLLSITAAQKCHDCSVLLIVGRADNIILHSKAVKAAVDTLIKNFQELGNIDTVVQMANHQTAGINPKSKHALCLLRAHGSAMRMCDDVDILLPGETGGSFKEHIFIIGNHILAGRNLDNTCADPRISDPVHDHSTHHVINFLHALALRLAIVGVEGSFRLVIKTGDADNMHPCPV